MKPSASEENSSERSCLLGFCDLEGDLIQIPRFFGFLNFECAFFFILNFEGGTWMVRIV